MQVGLELGWEMAHGGRDDPLGEIGYFEEGPIDANLKS